MTRLNGVLLSLILLVCLPVGAASPEIQIYTHELKPFTWEENGSLRGFAFDMVSAVMLKLNLRPDIKMVPFKRALLLVQKQRNWAIFHVQRTPEREKTMKWVGPIVKNGVYVYCHKKSAGKIRTIDDLRLLKHIAVVNGEATEEFLMKRGFTNLVHVRKQSQSLDMIISGTAEASAFGEMVIGAYAGEAKIDISQVEKTGIRLFDSVLYIGFSKNVPDDVISKWQRAVDDVKREKYDMLYDRYIRK